ncbi:MAG TPA: HAD hydrolase-like protein [Phototrophicaceae bacterium]|nr:HAD hydrolase-like protein [Phototrophicaceae bacterium]
MRLILFDIDCTLLLTRGAGREANRLAMLEVFGTVGALHAHKFGGKTDWQTLAELLTVQGISHTEIERQMPIYSEAMARHLGNILPDFEMIVMPGAHELIKALHARPDVALGIVTGNVPGSAEVKLRAAGFDPAMFPIGAFGNESIDRNRLPALAIARATEYYHTPFLPQDVIVVGDTPADIACARAVGAVAVAVETGFCEPGELEAAQPDYLLHDLTEFDRVPI